MKRINEKKEMKRILTQVLVARFSYYNVMRLWGESDFVSFLKLFFVFEEGSTLMLNHITLVLNHIGMCCMTNSSLRSLRICSQFSSNLMF